MDCRVKPGNDDAKAVVSLADARQRFLADIGINQLVDVAALGELAERDHLLLRPDQAFERNGEIGIDHAGLQSLLVDEGRARVVGLGADRLTRQRDGLVAMGHGIAHRLDLRGHEPDEVLAAVVERLARHQRAEAQELRQHLARLHQHAQALHRRQRQVLVGHHRGVDHAAEQRGEPVAVAADGGDLHLGRGNLGLHQRGARHHVGRRPGR